jgi:hypothetical protein
VSYLHHDQAGSTRLLTGSAGTVTGKYTYTPYGTIEEHTGTATTPSTTTPNTPAPIPDSSTSAHATTTIHCTIPH